MVTRRPRMTLGGCCSHPWRYQSSTLSKIRLSGLACATQAHSPLSLAMLMALVCGSGVGIGLSVPAHAACSSRLASGPAPLKPGMSPSAGPLQHQNSLHPQLEGQL
jgi:hypothetical protein